MKKIMFCGGGSAGHVIPNIAIIEELEKMYECSYIGTGGIEEGICRNNGINFHKFEAVKLVRGKVFKNLLIPFKIFKSISLAGEILDKEKPDLIFCKGGYVCYPPAVAAKKRGIPVITHESDLSAGLANKLIAKKCVKVLTAFPPTAEKFRNGVYAGTPMRRNLFGRDSEAAKKRFGFDNRPVIIVFGGGSGSQIINENLRKAVFEICKRFNVLHICGKGNTVQTSVYGYKQLEFADDMGIAYACADAAVSRCGSNSANELIALKIPTLFIPLDNGSSRGDQIKNAEYFLSRGLCRVLPEKSLTPENLESEIYALVEDEKLKTALGKHSSVCGNNKIVMEIKSILG